MIQKQISFLKFRKTLAETIGQQLLQYVQSNMGRKTYRYGKKQYKYNMAIY